MQCWLMSICWQIGVGDTDIVSDNAAESQMTECQRVACACHVIIWMCQTEMEQKILRSFLYVVQFMALISGKHRLLTMRSCENALLIC